MRLALSKMNVHLATCQASRPASQQVLARPDPSAGFEFIISFYGQFITTAGAATKVATIHPSHLCANSNSSELTISGTEIMATGQRWRLDGTPD